MNPSNPYMRLAQQQQSQSAQSVQPYQMKQPQRVMERHDDAQTKSSGGDMAGMGSMIGGMLSDERSKKEIQRLESANSALTKALSSKAEYPDTSAASSGMQALGQQSASPSRASFPDAPADKVAAQNVAMGAPPPQPMAQPQPQPQAAANPGFNVSRGMPDLAALDEAYRRQGMGG